MKSFYNLTIITTSVVLVLACARTPNAANLQTYQSQANKTLASYAGQMSNAFTAASQAFGSGQLGVTVGTGGSSTPTSTVPSTTFYNPNVYNPSTPGSLPPTQVSNNGYYAQPSYYLGGMGALGNYIQQGDITPEIQSCAALYNQTPPSVDSFAAALASLARCLNRVMVNQNSLLAYGYRSLDTSGQAMWGYLTDWRQPGSYSQFQPNNGLGGVLQLISANGW